LGSVSSEQMDSSTCERGVRRSESRGDEAARQMKSLTWRLRAAGFRAAGEADPCAHAPDNATAAASHRKRKAQL